MRDNKITVSLKKMNLPLGTVINFFHLSTIQVSNALLQILLFPVIIHVVGLVEFGHVMVANSYAGLLGIFINYGTNQSGIKDIALCQNSPPQLSEKFYSVFYIRVLLFVLSLSVIPCLHWFGVPDLHYFVFANALIFAEVLNPIFFFIGIEKLLIYNIANFISKLLSILLIIFFIKHTNDSYLVNFYLGIINVFIYLILFMYAIKKYNISFHLPKLVSLWHFIRENFYLVGNNISVHLQQSIFLFALSSTGNTLALGAYALCDKIIWAFRLIIISFSSAIYPRCTILFKEEYTTWVRYKKNINRTIWIIFLLSAVVSLTVPSLIVKIFTGVDNSLSSSYVRTVAFVPLVIALNSLNLLELLIRNKYAAIFRVSLVILVISALVSFLFLQLNNTSYFAFYPMVVETACLLLYLAYLKKNPHNPADSLQNS
jgi:O-antigen/teichoic acid export membrane protein